MKKIFFLFVSVALLIASLISCSSDDNGGSSSGSLVGKWYPEKVVTIFMGESDEEEHEHLCASKKDYVELKSNGTFLSVDHDEDCVAYEDEGTWVKEGNQLTVVSDGEAFTAEIVSITSSKFVIKETVTWAGMTIEYEIHYKK